MMDLSWKKHCWCLTKTDFKVIKLSFSTRANTTILVSLLILMACCPQISLCKMTSEEKEDLSVALGDSLEEDAEMEMPEYLDDEVRFVTDDDFLYEEERSHYRDFHQGARAGSNKFSQHYERCPPLPEPSAVVSSGLCDSKPCQRDDECSADGSVICCENGCGVYSCLPKVNPPLAFDWVEETDLKFTSADHNDLLQDPEFRQGPSTRALFHAESSPETISLPGGCFLNSKQYDDLILFRKFDHVTGCSCSKGEVFCEINHQEFDAKG